MQTQSGHMPMIDRYHFDFKTCQPSKGWAQLDTKQDASYFGTWVNPITLELVSYCEGDVTHIKCETEAEFKCELTNLIDWNKKQEYFIGIDGMMSPGIIAAFEKLGFAEYLH